MGVQTDDWVTMFQVTYSPGHVPTALQNEEVRITEERSAIRLATGDITAFVKRTETSAQGVTISLLER